MFTATVLLVMVLATQAYGSGKPGNESTLESLSQNVLSYAIAVIPAALFVRYCQKNPQFLAGSGALMSMLRSCVFGHSEDIPKEGATTSGANKPSGPKDVESQSSGEESFLKGALQIGFCVAGLQGSYLTWGVLQEQIMTQSYGEDADGNPIVFRDSQYLVFVNRVLALVAAFVVIHVTTQPRHTAPLHKYSFPSMSNILSSWCQYEALKYVNFPTQVLAKSSKIIPVMIMGKFVQGKTYPIHEYICAIVISMGVAIFLFSKASDEGKLDEEDDDSGVSLAGILLLVGYMTFDSFTSNFQSFLFKSYKMTSYQMMFGVNLFSCFFTLWSLIQRGVFFGFVQFTFSHSLFLFHVVLLSITSATGQMFIFYTISKYGPLVFAIIMTTRQVISIFVSALIFGHRFAAMGWVGILVVFVAMFGRIYLNSRSKK